MNDDFDARLTAMLARLDAAVPTPRQPLRLVPARPGSDRRTRGRVITVLAAAVLLASASVIAVTGTDAPRTAEQKAKDAADETRVWADLGALVSDDCLSPAEARTVFRQRLDALGLRDWSIRMTDGLREARCVSFGAVGDDREVVVVAGVGGDAARALDTVAADLMTRCLSAKEAAALVRSTLVGLGYTDANVQIGPAWAFPADDGGAFVEHMAAGCAVYSGGQSDNVGRFTFFVSTE
jgi:hypothetical protein